MFRCFPRPFAIGLFALGCTAVLAIALSLVPLSAAPAPVASKTVTVDLGNAKMEFVLIPRGKFMMGSPKEEKERRDDELQHEVEIAKPFYLAKSPVTQEQYEAITGKNPSCFRKDGEGADQVKDLDTKQFPVEMVSWHDAQTFCKKLTANDQLRRKFRLPTEAEWEYVCRAGATTPFSFGTELNGKQANCRGVEPYGTSDRGPYQGRTTKVGAYGANKWGLCDMHGNVWQWCEDYYGPYNDDLHSTDPLRSVKYAEEGRVMRGGSWSSNAKLCRAAYRDRAAPDNRNDVIGFRVAFPQD